VEQNPIEEGIDQGIELLFPIVATACEVFPFDFEREFLLVFSTPGESSKLFLVCLTNVNEIERRKATRMKRDYLHRKSRYASRP
jgi:hypothetical protein